MDHQAFAQVLGNYGEFLGAIAVVATLAYLARQIRDQNRANEIAAFESVMDGFNQLNAMLAADRGLYRNFIIGLNQPDELDDEAAGSFSFLIRMYLNTFNKMYRVYRRGAMPESEWRLFAAEAAQLMETPGLRTFLENQPTERWEYIQAIKAHLHQESVVDISLGRNPLRRRSI